MHHKAGKTLRNDLLTSQLLQLWGKMRARLGCSQSRISCCQMNETAFLYHFSWSNSLEGRYKEDYLNSKYNNSYHTKKQFLLPYPLPLSFSHLLNVLRSHPIHQYLFKLRADGFHLGTIKDKQRAGNNLALKKHHLF